MSLMKFITVFDDEKQKMLYNDVLRRYNISAWPTVYFCNGKPYYDGISTNSTEYMKLRNSNVSLVGPNIPAEVFQQALKFAYEDGFSVAVIVCPHKKWYPYYKEAVNAVKRVRRSTTMEFDNFRMCVIDTKSFAAGAMFFALELARLHLNHHCPTGIVLEDFKYIVSKTIILTKSGEKFGCKNGELSAVRVFGKRLYNDIKLSDSNEYVKFDNFANACAKYIRNNSGRYAISLGAGCDFSGSIIGRIEKILGYPPVATMQYGIASADVLGLDSICIHIL